MRPDYADIVPDVAAYLRERVRAALAAGIAPDRIIIDPGHDLNKNTYHSLELIRRLEEITAIGYPTLAAVSNKDFIGETLDRPQRERRRARSRRRHLRSCAARGSSGCTTCPPRWRGADDRGDARLAAAGGAQAQPGLTDPSNAWEGRRA